MTKKKEIQDTAQPQVDSVKENAVQEQPEVIQVEEIAGNNVVENPVLPGDNPLEEDAGNNLPVAETEAMKVVVLKRFRDKYDHVTWYEKDLEIWFDTKRALSLISRGIVKSVPAH